jgi:hypothetical protein
MPLSLLDLFGFVNYVIANEKLYERLRAKTAEAWSVIFDSTELLTFRMTNGGLAVTAGFARNHPPGLGIERHFLEKIALLAPATYGVLYAQDSDTDGPGGKFQVLKLANGTIAETEEQLVP